MQALLSLSRGIDAMNVFIGKSVSWLILLAVLVSAGNATYRWLFSSSSNAWLELQWFSYGAAFLLAAAYTLQRNEHVRIDVVASSFSKRTRDWIDLVCHFLFLIPFCLVLIYYSLPFVLTSLNAELQWSWPFLVRLGEPQVSDNAGGLLSWPARLMILLGFTLLFLQAISEIIKRIAVIGGIIDDPNEIHDMPPLVEELETAAEIESRRLDK